MTKQLFHLKELFNALNSGKIPFVVCGGWALDAKKGKLSRKHKDIDLFCLKSDLKKIKQVMKNKKYSFVYRINDLVRFENKKKLKIDFCLIKKSVKTCSCKLRFVIVRFPLKMFTNPQMGRVGKLSFAIVPDEILKKWGLNSRYPKDVLFAKSIQVSESALNKVKEEKISRLLKNSK